jgi:hypothetical protein
MTPPGIWTLVHRRLAVEPPGTRLAYEKRSLPHPRAVGAYPSAGWPTGQIADFRFPPDSACRGLHVHEFSEHWVVHLDRVHPECNLVGHVVADVPAAVASGGALLGAVVGATISKSAAGAVLGGMVGLLAGALMAHQADTIKNKHNP